MGSTGKTGSGVNPGVKSVVMPDGTNILLDEELVYGKDSARAPQLPKNIVDFENKRRTAKIEYILLTDDAGNEIESRKGGKSGVKSTLRANSQAALITHNHPRSGAEIGALGGTFSSQDLDNFVRFNNQRTLRAVAGEGTYSISKLPGFKPSLLRAYADYGREIYSELKGQADAAYKVYKNASDTAYNDWRNNRISREQMNDISSKAYKEYEKTAMKVFNTELIRKHNWLIANQSKYGYTYGLER